MNSSQAQERITESEVNINNLFDKCKNLEYEDTLLSGRINQNFTSLTNFITEV